MGKVFLFPFECLTGSPMTRVKLRDEKYEDLIFNPPFLPPVSTYDPYIIEG